MILHDIHVLWPAINHNRLCFRDQFSLIQVTPKCFSLHRKKKSLNVRLLIAPNTYTCLCTLKMSTNESWSRAGFIHCSPLLISSSISSSGKSMWEKMGGMKQKSHKKCKILSLKKNRITRRAKTCSKSGEGSRAQVLWGEAEGSWALLPEGGRGETLLSTAIWKEAVAWRVLVSSPK